MFAFPFGVQEAHWYHRYSNALLEKIGVSYSGSSHEKAGFRERCGTIVFCSSPGTLTLINEMGSGYLLKRQILGISRVIAIAITRSRTGHLCRLLGQPKDSGCFAQD